MDFSKKVLLWLATPALAIAAPWKKHVIYEGARANVAVAADFTGDGKLDVISNSGQQTRLFVAPDWKEHIIDDTAGHNFIHCLLYTSPSPRDRQKSRMPSSA